MKRVSWIFGLDLRLPALQLTELVLQLVLCLLGFGSTRFDVCLLPSLCLFQQCNLSFLICVPSISRDSVSNSCFHGARTRGLSFVLSHRQHGTLVERDPTFLPEVPATKDNIISITLGKENKEIVCVPTDPIMVHPPSEGDGSAAFNSVTVGIVKMWCCRRWRNFCNSPQSAYKPMRYPIPDIA